METSKTPNSRVLLMTEEELEIKIQGAVEKAFLNYGQQNKKGDDKEPMSVKEAAEYLGCQQQTIYDYHYKGILSAYKPFGKRLYFYKETLDEVLKGKKSKSNAELSNEADAQLIASNRRRAS